LIKTKVFYLLLRGINTVFYTHEGSLFENNSAILTFYAG